MNTAPLDKNERTRDIYEEIRSYPKPPLIPLLAPDDLSFLEKLGIKSGKVSPGILTCVSNKTQQKAFYKLQRMGISKESLSVLRQSFLTLCLDFDIEPPLMLRLLLSHIVVIAVTGCTIQVCNLLFLVWKNVMCSVMRLENFCKAQLIHRRESVESRDISASTGDFYF